MARRKRLSFSLDAYEDLEGIFLHIAQHGSGAARRQIARLLRQAESLRDFPNLGRDRSRLAPALRSVVEGTYVIFYYARDDRIDIVRVLHGRQDVEAEFISFLERTVDSGSG